jgi:prepilin signal peptidase PulO-like enzyme (type II secretory pathway)
MIIVSLAVLGLIFGSFVNAWVWRLHETEALQGKKGKAVTARRKALSITKGRSMCPACGHELAAKDLVPVFSWLYLRGKCRYCRAPIADSPLTELATSALFVLSYIAWPLALSGVGLAVFMFWIAFVVAFVALTVYDLRWMMLPDRIVLPLIALAGVQVLMVAVWLHDYANLWQPAVSGLIIFGLFWVLYQVSDGRWIGGGDVKLAPILGLLAGTPFKAVLVIFFASLIGTVLSIPALLKGKKALGMHVPFGPSLIAAAIVVVLYGSQLAAWYQNLLVGS